MRKVMYVVMILLGSPIPTISGFADDKKPVIRPLKNVVLVKSDVFGDPKPVEITTADALDQSKAFADDASRTAAKKQVDFATENLVVFAWSGSGRDQLTPELKTDGKKLVAVFVYRVGETDDLAHHTQAFVVPKNAVVEVKK